MKFYFLTHKNMADTFKNALKTGAIIAGLATNPALADDTTNSKVATIVAINGDSIDNNPKLTQINYKISELEKKIAKMEENGESKRKIFILGEELKTLSDQRDSIRDEGILSKKIESDEKDKTIADKDETIKSKKDEIKNILASK